MSAKSILWAALALSLGLVVGLAARAGQAAETPAGDAQAEARLRAETEHEIRKNIRQLGTPNWRAASARLICLGRPAVPFLIAALSGGVDPSYPAAAYAVQAPGRTSRPRPLNDVVYGILCHLFQNHTNYQGALPGQDRQAWEQFWARNEGNIQFGQP